MDDEKAAGIGWCARALFGLCADVAGTDHGRMRCRREVRGSHVWRWLEDVQRQGHKRARSTVGIFPMSAIEELECSIFNDELIAIVRKHVLTVLDKNYGLLGEVSLPPIGSLDVSGFQKFANIPHVFVLQSCLQKPSALASLFGTQFELSNTHPLITLTMWLQ